MAVPLSGIPGVSHFDTVGELATLAPCWSRWLQEFKLYVTAAGVADPSQKRALLLHLAGHGVRDIFLTARLTEVRMINMRRPRNCCQIILNRRRM